MLDVDLFATYLALEDLIDNFDDISGPGNNSYLLWDSATQKFTIVAWDHNPASACRTSAAVAGHGVRPLAAVRPAGAPSRTTGAQGGAAPTGGGAGGGGMPAAARPTTRS
jgi:spore coat protein CotH